MQAQVTTLSRTRVQRATRGAFGWRSKPQTFNRAAKSHLRSAQALSLSMATAASVLAIVRAAGPSFRNGHDQLAFAVHASVLSAGYRLVALGDHAQLEGLSAEAPDIPVTGWNSSSEQYTFAYLSEDPSTADQAATAAAAAPTKLLVKSLVLGDSLLSTIATDKADIEPKVLELPVSDYVMTGEAAAAAGSAAKTYKNLDQLTKTLNAAVSEVSGAAAAGVGGESSQKKQKTEGTTTAAAGTSSRDPSYLRSSRPDPDVDPDHDPLRVGPIHRPPMRVGHDDIMPVLGGVPGIVPGGLPGGPPLGGGGGGMHVGPGHPFFADRMRNPDLLPGRGGLGSGGPMGPGGVRWDPINPEGLQGWQPEDFQRPRPGQGGGRGFNPDIHPDIGQPGPGRGADWDNMFG